MVMMDFKAVATGFLVRSFTSNVIFKDCIANGNAQQEDITWRGSRI